jgi:hypothetical protein
VLIIIILFATSTPKIYHDRFSKKASPVAACLKNARLTLKAKSCIFQFFLQSRDINQAGGLSQRVVAYNRKVAADVHTASSTIILSIFTGIRYFIVMSARNKDNGKIFGDAT